MGLTHDEMIKTLREWRNSAVRRSAEVVEIGERLLRKANSRLFDDELWLIYEQVYVASLDTQRFDLADMCMEKLAANFPGSSRVQKLQGMKLEAQGMFSEALALYEHVAEQDPTNAGVRKRKVAVLKAQRRIGAAIKELTAYLQTFMADFDAWFELSELYLKEMDYAKAAFCMEELIVSNAFNHLYHQRYAEIRYTLGGAENLEIARQHFSQAVKLSSNSNMRALYGLLLVCSAAVSSKSSSKSGSSRLHATWAAKMISAKYSSVWSSGEAAMDKIVASKEIPQLSASACQVLKQLGGGDATA